MVDEGGRGLSSSLDRVRSRCTQGAALCSRFTLDRMQALSCLLSCRCFTFDDGLGWKVTGGDEGKCQRASVRRTGECSGVRDAYAGGVGGGMMSHHTWRLGVSRSIWG